MADYATQRLTEQQGAGPTSHREAGRERGERERALVRGRGNGRREREASDEAE